jgi:hypothetical protein
MRRLQAPTLRQWGCPHHWKTTHSLPQEDALHRVRYHKCRRCGLRVKTEEQLAVPWGERDLVALVKHLLPEGQPVSLRDQGMTELPLSRLNAILARHGLMIHATTVHDPQRFGACTTKHGRMEQFGVFELRRIHQDAPGRTNGRRRQGRPV